MIKGLILYYHNIYICTSTPQTTTQKAAHHNLNIINNLSIVNFNYVECNFPIELYVLLNTIIGFILILCSTL